MVQSKQASAFSQTDKKVIADALDAMKRMVLAHGGEVHPQACIEERDGLMRVLCNDPQATGQTLFRIPDTLLVPFGDLSWSDHEDLLQLAKPPADFTPERAEMLDIFLTIYNSTGKLAFTRKQPTSVLNQDAAFAAQVELVCHVPEHRYRSLAEIFFKFRRYSSEHAQAGVAGKPCLMPLIDFLNHHLDGQPSSHAAGFLHVNVKQPAQSTECFASYGLRYDPLILALLHGFLDPVISYANSVPFKTDIQGFGHIEVIGQWPKSKHKSYPPQVTFNEDGLCLSHLVCDASHPQSAKATLQLAMMASGRRRGIADATIAAAIAEMPTLILSANRDKLERFRAYLASRPDLPFAALLSDASRCVMANLERTFARRA